MSHPEQTRDPVRLERLEVRAFRHIAHPISLELGDGPVLLLGRNGTGKTNLLGLIDAIVRLDFGAFESDPQGFDITFRLRWEDLSLEMTLAWAPPSQQPLRTRYRYSGTARAASGEEVTFEVAPGKVRGGHPLAEGEEKPNPFEPRFNDALAWFLSTIGTQDGERRLDRWLHRLLFWGSELTASNGRFDEALEGFRIITEPGAGRATLVVLNSPGYNYQTATSMPTEVVNAYLERSAPERLQPVSDEVGWLPEAAEACGFDRLELQTPPPREERPGPNQINRTYAPFMWYAQRGSSRFPHHDFSFGQKRIVAAFWYLACVRDFGGVVVADELVNGLHHEALRLVLRQAEGLQAFHASQNPLLFDFMEYASVQEFRTRVIRCEPAPDGWSWRNPTDAEAQRFLDAYGQGFQQVSEILRVEDLW